MTFTFQPRFSPGPPLRALLLLAFWFLQAPSAHACSACYGQSDSPMAAGMNWGIVSLLGVVGLVLAGVAAFFMFLARRSRALSRRPTEPASSARPSTDQAVPLSEPAPAVSVFLSGLTSTDCHHHSRLMASVGSSRPALTSRCERPSIRSRNRS